MLQKGDWFLLWNRMNYYDPYAQTLSEITKKQRLFNRYGTRMDQFTDIRFEFTLGTTIRNYEKLKTIFDLYNNSIYDNTCILCLVNDTKDGVISVTDGCVVPIKTKIYEEHCFHGVNFDHELLVTGSEWFIEDLHDIDFIEFIFRSIFIHAKDYIEVDFCSVARCIVQSIEKYCHFFYYEDYVHFTFTDHDKTVKRNQDEQIFFDRDLYCFLNDREDNKVYRKSNIPRFIFRTLSLSANVEEGIFESQLTEAQIEENKKLLEQQELLEKQPEEQPEEQPEGQPEEQPEGQPEEQLEEQPEEQPEEQQEDDNFIIDINMDDHSNTKSVNDEDDEEDEDYFDWQTLVDELPEEDFIALAEINGWDQEEIDAVLPASSYRHDEDLDLL